jgi:hypothetical protein
MKRKNNGTKCKQRNSVLDKRNPSPPTMNRSRSRDDGPIVYIKIKIVTAQGSPFPIPESMPCVRG